jgi:hypothetical protein
MTTFKGILLAQVKKHCTHYFVSPRGSPTTVSVQGALDGVNPCFETVFARTVAYALAYPLFKWFFERRKKPEPIIRKKEKSRRP